MINPILAADMATLTQVADSYRQDLNAQFCHPHGSRRHTDGNPGVAARPDVSGGSAGGDSRRRVRANPGATSCRSTARSSS